MKYICEFCGTEFYSAAENFDGTKCANCKKGRLKNAEICEIDEFLAELDKELEEFHLELGLEVCEGLQCELCGEDCSDEPIAADPSMLKDYSKDPANTPAFQDILNQYEANEGLTSGLKEIGEDAAKDLRARIFGGIKRKSGEYCRNCVYYKPDYRTEGKAHYSEGNCTVENWVRKLAFDWCKSYSRRRKNAS